ncbi:non-ribosomal peptide synthetase [Kutzneria buriramensis]|uniref:Amino acid adenylation domain-containing protein n=1 Tax=Kutzneria buriramensis TaxID=1045776 RepID=A0A3E0HEX3_9PSEU|nr:non-ribosomal peptide synthetase [Kutzneria buriramensis]REH43723.1 amino acid adenylation domain-containing protein [Kutzneria buriramensis]
MRRADTVHGLFADCARRWPDATAIVHGDRRLTYRELAALSEDYAAELAARGVGPGEHVAVVMKRDPEMVAALLAIMMRGAVYAGIDPRWPRERSASLVRRLHARLVVSPLDGWDVPSWTPGASSGRSVPPVAVSRDDPAHIFFTSGSTGEPKGVVVAHRGTVRLYDDCAFGDFGPGAVQTQTMPTHWDGSLLDLWSALLSGGTSVFVDDVLLPSLVRDLVSAHGLNTLCLPTAVFNLLVDEGVDAFEGIRYAFIVGEKASDAHCRRLLERFPTMTLTNAYGPVESAGIVSYRRVSIEDTRADVPIGVPVTDSDVHVFDGTRPCAPGQVGELCLSGDGLALGYLDDPELTARQFVTLETAGGPQLVYRTGDLGYVTADGVLHYVARNDLQVKVRGHRIEPGEIERVAEQVPGIRQAVVVPIKGPDGAYTDLRLSFVAVEVSPSALRSSLASRLPAYLIPRQIERLDAIPLTRNGKVDRKALAGGPSRIAVEIVTDNTRSLVASTCAQVLGIPDISADTSLALLGANSLELARICTRLVTATGVTLPLSQLYRTPRVADLAAWIDSAARRPVVVSRSNRFPLTAGQATYVDSNDILMLTWWVDGPLDVEALETALNDVHLRHQTLHARYQRTSVTVGDPGCVEFATLPATPDAEAAVLSLTKHLHEPLSLAAGRVWRALTVSDGSRTAFGIAVHHIAYDGHSRSLLLNDLATAYASRVRGVAPVWTVPAPTLAEVSAAHRSHLGATDLAAQRRYWRSQLSDLPACLDIPAGHSVGPALLHSFPPLAAGTFPELVAAVADALRSFVKDVALLAPVSVRGNPVLDAAITYRANPLCLRLQPGSEARTVADALAAQDLAFTEVAMTTPGLAPVLGTLPVLLVQDDDRTPLRLTGCATEPIDDVGALEMACPLLIEVVPNHELRIGIRTDLLPAELIDDLAARLGLVED